MWVVVNVNDEPEVGKAGQQIAAPFQRNDFICLQTSCYFVIVFFAPFSALNHPAVPLQRGSFYCSKAPTSPGCTPSGMYNVNSSEVDISQPVSQTDAQSKPEYSELEQILPSFSISTFKLQISAQLSAHITEADDCTKSYSSHILCKSDQETTTTQFTPLVHHFCRHCDHWELFCPFCSPVLCQDLTLFIAIKEC